MERSEADAPTGAFTRRLVVTPDAIDANDHVNNIAYVQWMQDVAIEHSTSLGWTMERYRSIGATWVARSHFVEYLRPAFVGETLAAHTWIAGLAEHSCPRRYLFVRESDGRVVVSAETEWVWVNARSGRPARIPEEVRAAFPVLADEDAAAALGLARLR